MNTLLFIGGLGLPEVLVIALVVLLLFGGKKIPELMKGLGKGVRSFKEGMKEIDDEVKSTDSDSKK
ncbi:MAG: twin-arginine translocase TatA/TatE family subunit [Muribaculaceae bacterium]|nr:twin-arginine translocase TatA/TatE family subunit [Muribaculaceae bacterium]